MVVRLSSATKKYHRYYSGFIAVQNYQIAPINFRVISEEVNLKEEIQDIFDAINDVVKVFKGFPRLYIMVNRQVPCLLS